MERQFPGQENSPRLITKKLLQRNKKNKKSIILDFALTWNQKDKIVRGQFVTKIGKTGSLKLEGHRTGGDRV